MIISISLSARRRRLAGMTICSLLLALFFLALTAPVLALPAPGGAIFADKSAYSATPT